MTAQGEDILAWLETAISEREETARKAAALCGCHPPAPAWSFRDGDGPTDGRILVVDDPHPGVKRKISRRWNGSYEGLFMAQHVVLHDPESVLRRCAADRKLLARHTPHHSEPAGGLICAHDQHRWPCPDITDLAEGYGWTEGER